MLTFFRRIRQKLWFESNLRKYSAYAVGEILLVMIGILLALQVNNWNENHKDLQKEKLILQNLHKSFEFNLEELNQTLSSTRRGYNATVKLLEFIHPDFSNHTVYKVDSLFAIIQEYFTYDPATGVIDEIINSGQLSLVRNEEVRNQVTNWSRILSDAGKNLKIADDHLFNVLMNYVMEHANFRNVPRQVHLFRKTNLQKIPSSNFTSDYKSMMTSLKFENLVNQHAWNLIWIINEYMNIQSYLETTISVLDNEMR